MAAPVVSLLVPVFNRADLLGACIESALAQTMPDLEVVVVDGASTDGTWDVCLHYAALDPRVRVFREAQNSGPVLGWWRCVEEASGNHATFLWSDDLLKPTFLQRTLPYLADDEIAFAYTAAEVGDSPGSGKIRYAQKGSPIVSSDSFILGALTTRGQYPLSPTCALFRLGDLRSNFTRELPTDPPTDLTATGAGTDVLFYLLAASERPKVAHVPEALAFFRAHKGSISVQGRDGLVSRSYAATKAWFAERYGRRDLLPTIVAWHWLADMRSSRRAISPTAAVDRYGGVVSAPNLVLAASRLLFGLAFARLPWIGDMAQRRIKRA